MSWRASNGLRLWLLQRLSAVCVVTFLMFVLISLARAPSISFSAWHGWVAQPLVNAAFSLFIVALLAHAWVGARDVIMDYVKPAMWRFIVLTLLALFLFVCLFWSLRVLFSVTMS